MGDSTIAISLSFIRIDGKTSAFLNEISESPVNPANSFCLVYKGGPPMPRVIT